MYKIQQKKGTTKTNPTVAPELEEVPEGRLTRLVIQNYGRTTALQGTLENRSSVGKDTVTRGRRNNLHCDETAIVNSTVVLIQLNENNIEW